MQSIVCLRCRREIEAGQLVAFSMFAQTVGVKPRQKSGALEDLFLSGGAGLLGMGMPPEGALHLVTEDLIRDRVSAEPSLNVE